jgi:hypothetical protein
MKNTMKKITQHFTLFNLYFGYMNALLVTYLLVSVPPLFTSCTQDTPEPIPREQVSLTPVSFTHNIRPFAATYGTTSNLNSGEVALYSGSSTTSKTYITAGGELIPKAAADEIYLSSTPTLITAYYPKAALTNGANIGITLSNPFTQRDTNKDIVWVSAMFTKDDPTYSLTFSHLFSLLEVEFVSGTTTDDISSYYPIYYAKQGVVFKPPFSDQYDFSGASGKYYFFDASSAQSFGCIIPKDEDAYIMIHTGVKELQDKAYIKDLFPTIEAGKRYKVTITVNQDELTIGSVSVDNWSTGGNGSLTIIT